MSYKKTWEIVMIRESYRLPGFCAPFCLFPFSFLSGFLSKYIGLSACISIDTPLNSSNKYLGSSHFHLYHLQRAGWPSLKWYLQFLGSPLIWPARLLSCNCLHCFCELCLLFFFTILLHKVLCPGFGWHRLNFLLSRWYSTVIWI